MSPFLIINEWTINESFWLREHHDQHQEEVIRVLNVFCYKCNVFWWRGRLRNVPITLVRKTPILPNTNHRLTELIVFNIHKMLKNVSPKYVLTEFCQFFWVCRGRSFVRRKMKHCTLCRKFECQCYYFHVNLVLTREILLLLMVSDHFTPKILNFE